MNQFEFKYLLLSQLALERFFVVFGVDTKEGESVEDAKKRMQENIKAQEAAQKEGMEKINEQTKINM